MNPPFVGTKVVTNIKQEDIFPLIDTHALFVGRWQFRRTKATEEAYQNILKQKAWPAFEEWKQRCIEEKILEPKVVYGYFTGEDVGVAGFSLRNKRTLKGATPKIVPLQIITVGSKVAEKCAQLFAAQRYTDYLYLHGLAVETTEALAEYWNKEILKELEKGDRLLFTLRAKSRRKSSLSPFSRISPGYPAWPNLSDQKELCRLLDAERIGVTVTETFQLVPEYSTSAMIIMQETTSKPAI